MTKKNDVLWGKKKKSLNVKGALKKSYLETKAK